MIILLFPNKSYCEYGWWSEFPAAIATEMDKRGIPVVVLYRRSGGPGKRSQLAGDD